MQCSLLTVQRHLPEHFCVRIEHSSFSIDSCPTSSSSSRRITNATTCRCWPPACWSTRASGCSSWTMGRRTGRARSRIVWRPSTRAASRSCTARAARARTLLHRRPAARDCGRDGGLRLPDGRRPLAQSGLSARSRGRGGDARPRDRLALPERRQRRQLAAASDVSQRVRQPLHPARDAACRRATARADSAAGGARRWRGCRIANDGVGRLRVPRRDAVRRQRGRDAGSARCRSSSSNGARVSRSSRPACSSNRSSCRGGSCSADSGADVRHVVVMVTTSYPAVSGRQRRHVHGADRQRASRRAATRSTSSRRGIRAITRGTRRGRRPLPLLQVRAAACAERLRLRGRACARTCSLRARGLDGRAARAGGRLASRRCASRRNGARRSCTVTGSCRAARSRRPPRPALPLVVSLHGSDVFVAERVALAQARRGTRVPSRRVRDGVQRRPRARAPSRSAPRPIAWTSFPTAWTPRSSHPTPTRPCRMPGPPGAGARRAAHLHGGTARAEEGFRISDRRASAARSAGRAPCWPSRERAISPASSRDRARAAGVADRVRLLGDLPQGAGRQMVRGGRRRGRAVRPR